MRERERERERETVWERWCRQFVSSRFYCENSIPGIDKTLQVFRRITRLEIALIIFEVEKNENRQKEAGIGPLKSLPKSGLYEILQKCEIIVNWIIKKNNSCKWHIQNFSLNYWFHSSQSGQLLAMWPDWAIYWTMGNFSMPVATISLSKSPTFLGNFCKGVKMFNFSSEFIFGQLF